MTVRSAMAFFTCALIVGSASLGCADDYMLERTQHNIAQLRSFHGVLIENGVLASGQMRSEVLFKRPNLFLSRVVSPPSYAGVTLAYNGKQLTVYYPSANYAIQFDNLVAPTPEDEHRLIADAYRHNQATFRYRLGGSSTVAGHPVVLLDYKAKQAGFVHPWGNTKVYDKYSMALGGVLQFGDDVQYSFHFDEIKFDEAIDDARFLIALPKNVILSRWDMASPGVPEREMREQANFELTLPHVPDGFALERIVRQDGPVPSFTAVYRRGAQFLFLSLWKDLGIRVVPEEHGVPITLGDKRGHLVIGPTLSSFAMSWRGTMYVFLGNLPFDQILSIAREL